MAKQPTPVEPETIYLLAIGISDGTKGLKQAKRAEEALRREGLRCGIASPETITTVARQIEAGDAAGDWQQSAVRDIEKGNK